MTYRNKTDQEHVIAGVGTVAAGATIDTDKKIENANFELVGEEKPQQPAPQPQPAAQPQQPTQPVQGGVK